MDAPEHNRRENDALTELLSLQNDRNTIKT